MGRRASFVIRENGKDRFLVDRYAGGDVVSSLLHGLDSAMNMIDWGSDVISIMDEVWGEAGVILDYDAQVLLFWGSDYLMSETPLIPYLLDLMKTTRWVGWDVRWAKWGMLSMAEYLGKPRSSVCKPFQLSTEELSSEERRKNRLDRWLKGENYYNELGTIITHRNLKGEFLDYTTVNFIDDTLRLGKDIFLILQNKETSPLPREIYFDDSTHVNNYVYINKCLYIDEIDRTIHVFWGYPLSNNCLFYELHRYWLDWQIKWQYKGYAGHLKLTKRENNDLLVSREEAINNLLKIFSDPLIRGINSKHDQNDSVNVEHIREWEKDLESLEKIKQEYLMKNKMS
ncbi:hypothetical protein H1P_10012 [Hyella patelloides LEGE 07179]|uniref:Uncharacterized protein n=1 Tax=Hyella patelloides LEGE 07179 TaxID=945734 RepID=A0A563VIS5_9CYAN|nr:hypothetical protein [Hyella patelloides]VEP11227.1 hypothetical protein H1P_10012 [Hyella patelloides LEGE 07179]